MSHEITATDAIAYLLSDGQPWHGIGNVLEEVAEQLGIAIEDLTVVQAMKGIGMDVSINTETPFTIHPDHIETFRALWRNGDGIAREQIVRAIREGLEPWQKHQAIVRSDNRAQFALLGSAFKPWQNEDAGRFFDEIVRAAGGAKLSVLGTLQGGRTVWITARLDATTKIGGTEDVSDYHLLCTHAHDGTQSVRFMVVQTRVVCANTRRIALSERGGKTQFAIKLRHTENMKTRLDDVKRALGIIGERIKNEDAIANFLASVQVPSAGALKAFVEALVPPADEGKSDTRREKKRDAIYRNFMDTDRNAVSGVKGSWWTAFNAVTQMVDHPENGDGDIDKAEKRFRSSMFGAGDALKQEAFSLAVVGARGERFTSDGAAVTVSSPAGTVTVDGSGVLDSLLSKPVGGQN